MKLEVTVSHWPITGGFRISRGIKHEAEVIEVTVSDGGVVGRGEAVPYARYGEATEEVVAELKALVVRGGTGFGEAKQLRTGAARNALDAALWDWESQRQRKPVWELLGLRAPLPVTTAFTLSVDTPDAMATRARRERGRPFFKLKAAGEGDLERVIAVHDACPETPLIVDANEGWSVEAYESLAPAFADLGVVLIEQPFATGEDAVLASLDRPVPVCADESFMRVGQLADLASRYDAVNVKLDKTGGLTEAVVCMRAAHTLGLDVMLGCNVCTSLGIAPMFMLVGEAQYVDLDGPLLLSRDREGGVVWDGERLHPPHLWGFGSEEDASADSQS